MGAWDVWKGRHCHPHTGRQGEERRREEVEPEEAFLYQPFAVSTLLKVTQNIPYTYIIGNKTVNDYSFLILS